MSHSNLRPFWIAGLVAGLVAGVLVRRRLARRQRAFSSQTVATALGTVEYAVMGEGVPVLVLHGAGGGCDQGLHMAAPLARKGYRLIAPSRFGYQRSSVPHNSSPMAQAVAYGELLDKLGVQKAIVMAISAGAWSALHFAARYPERCRALVLLVPATKLPKGTKMYGGLAARTLLRSNLAGGLVLRLAAALPRFAAALLGTPTALLQGLSPKERQRVRQLLYDGLPVAECADGMKLDIATAKGRDGFPMERVTCPVLAVSAQDDAFRTAGRAREIARAVPHGTAIVFPTGGHLLVGRFDEATRDVVAFLSKVV